MATFACQQSMDAMVAESESGKPQGIGKVQASIKVSQQRFTGDFRHRVDRLRAMLVTHAERQVDSPPELPMQFVLELNYNEQLR